MRMAWVSRLLIFAALLSLLGGTGIFFKAQTERRQEFFGNFADFDPVEDLEFYDLVQDHVEVPVLLSVSKEDGSPGVTLGFHLDEGSPVYLSASAGSAEVIFVHPLILERENKEKLLLPLIRSSTPGRHITSSIRLGWFAAGDHTLTLTQDASASLPIPASLRLNASRPNQESALTVFIDHHPMIEVKDLNGLGNVLDDIPLLSYSHLYQRSNEYLVTSHLIFSSENGGRLPPSLMDSFDRTVDVEWVMKQMFVQTDEQLLITHQQYQGKDHQAKKFGEGPLFGVSPMLAIETENNNFSDGRGGFDRLAALNFFSREEDLPIRYAPKPIFLPPGQGSDDIIERIPELQKWSMFEVAMENCVDTHDSEDPTVQQFLADLSWIQQYLTVSFPDRGCGGTLLALPDRNLEQEATHSVWGKPQALQQSIHFKNKYTLQLW